MAGSEDEVWRLPSRIRGEDARLLPSSSPLTKAAKERLARIVRRTPEVMVKITGRSRGLAGLKSHLDYITRNGRLEGETNSGLPVHDRADLRRLHDDWLLANAVMSRSGSNPHAAQSVGIILSMPRGTPKDRVHDAARTWAIESFGDRYDWLLVRHEDRDHPHVHLTIRAVGDDGRRLAPGPADLQRWRERFARELRRLGVPAEATPRQARGKVQRADTAALHRIKQRGGQSTVQQIQLLDAARAARADSKGGWEQAIQARQEAIRRAYLHRAAELETGPADDRQLADDIRRFVAGLPVGLTQRQTLAAELRAVQQHHQADDRPHHIEPGIAREAGLTSAPIEQRVRQRRR